MENLLDDLDCRVRQLTRGDQLLLVERVVRRLRNADVSMDAALDALAADPDIQREIRAIEREFAETEADGLGVE